MAEEGGKVLEDRIEVRLSRLEEGQDSLRQAVARLNGTTEQMDRRLSNVEQLLRQMQGSLDGVRGSMEQGSRWVIGLVVGAWLTIMLTILFKG